MGIKGDDSRKDNRSHALWLARELGLYSTPNISDALDRFRIKGGLEGILPIVEGLKMFGPAFTVRYLPVDQTIRKPWRTYIDQVGTGDVIVVDNGGRTYCTTWGDLLTMKALQLGVSGTVLFGCCRDVDAIRKMRYPLFSKGRFMMTGKDRVEVDAVNTPVTMADVRISPGDIIIGDDSGVICVPLEKAQEVLESVKEISTRESGIAEAIKKGISLTSAREEYGYEKLQRPKD